MSKEEAKLLNCHLELGPEYPEFGELDGKPVRLDDVEDTLPMDVWPNVWIALPSGIRTRPWRNLPGF